MNVDPTVAFLIASGVGIGAGGLFSIYKIARVMLSGSFVSKADFDAFRDRQSEHDRAQQSAIDSIATDIKWIKESLVRTENVLTGEHKRPDNFR